MSTPNPIEQAAIPSAIAALTALKTFLTTVTSADPTTLPAVVPAALQVFIGTVELQAPTLASNELAAVGTVGVSTINGWISKLQALVPAAAK